MLDATHWICHYRLRIGLEYSLWRTFCSLWLGHYWWISRDDGFPSSSPYMYILPGDKGFGTTFLELHFYTWAYVGYTGLLLGMAVLLMLPNREVRSRSWFANALVIIFYAIGIR